MGDGTVEASRNTGRMSIEMVSDNFLEWVDDELGWLTTGVKLKHTAEEKVERAINDPHIDTESINPENYQAIYRLRTVYHPYLKELRKWYSTGEKRIPNNITLNPLIVKMWYVCDGTLAFSRNNPNVETPCVRIYSSNEDDRLDFICSLFEEVGFNPTETVEAIRFNLQDTKSILDWMGEPPPDFNYKWLN